MSGVNFRLFHAFFAPPKKVADRTDEDKQAMQRQKEIVRNFPQLGGTVEAQLVIEPHTFPIRLYGPREIIRHVQKKPAAPQYGAWGNHNQQPHYQQQQYHNSPMPYSKPVTPQPRPPPPKPQPQPKPPTSQPGSSSGPAPDPVIHMLAQRAGTDPQLKAVMKIVAQGKATPEQLEYFQGHITELTNILARQKESEARQPPPAVVQAPSPAPTQSATTAPSPQVSQPPVKQPPQQPVIQEVQTPQKTEKPSVSNPTPTPLQHVTPTPSQPSTLPNQYPQSSTPASSSPHPNQYTKPPQPNQYTRPPQPNQYTRPPQPNQYAKPPQPNQYTKPPQPNQYTYNQPHHQMNTYNSVNQPPRTSYRPLVFDFVEGNGDKFYFPSYSIMEWLPNNQGVKFSFLLTKMKPKPKTEPKQTLPATPAPKVQSTPTPAPAPAPAATPNTPMMPGPNGVHNTPNPTPVQVTPSTPITQQYNPPPRIEDFDEKNDLKDIEFYQPVTVVILSANFEILQSLPRAVRPPDVVEKYMNEVFDNCRRTEETYLAFKLPREGAPDAEAGSRRMSVDPTPAVSTPVVDIVMGGTGVTAEKKKAGRPRKSLVV